MPACLPTLLLLQWAIPHLLGFNEGFHSPPKLENGSSYGGGMPPF